MESRPGTNTRKGTPIVVAVLAVLAAPAHAGPDEATAAYDRGDCAQALNQWTPLAEKGDAEAQLKLGDLYLKCQGVARDEAEALKWYRRAAERGYAPAQSQLGFMYEKGLGVPKDEVEAVKWYLKSADQGWANAQYNHVELLSLAVPAAQYWPNLEHSQDRAWSPSPGRS